MAVWINLDALKLWDKNYNKGDVQYIKGLIQRFGFNGALRVWRDCVVIAGNHSTMALRELKAENWMPVGGGIRVVPDGWEIDIVDASHLDPAEAAAFAIGDNESSRRALPDELLMTGLLKDIYAADPGLTAVLGYDDGALTRMFKDLDTSIPMPADTSPAADVPGAPDLGAEAQTRWQVAPGQIWLIPSKSGKGVHRLMCGDCRDSNQVARLIDQPVQGIFTSPPYAEQRTAQYGGIPASHYVDWFRQVADTTLNHLLPNGSFFVNIKPHVEDGSRSLYVHDLVAAMVRDWSWLLIDEFCWLRIGVPGSWRNRFKNGFEPIYHFARTADIRFHAGYVSHESSGSVDGRENVNTGSYFNTASVTWDRALPSNVLDIKQNAGGKGHPAAFPTELPAFFIDAFSGMGDAWYDPFTGSGTTLVAAEMNYRIGYGMELKPEYCAIALSEMAKLGLEPRLA